ncbi:MAG: O-methyltransferase [Actinomycetota bacterium]|nr:O-methyltransferase [Actinomycetota bacterium]
MTSDLWKAVDRFICERLLPPDAALDAALAHSADAGLPAISVTPNQGMLLAQLVQLCSARRVLEIGTLGGYSAIWLAHGLEPGGQLITLEVDPHYAGVARTNIAGAGLAQVVEVRVGRALESLAQLGAEGAGAFDLTFIDADKPNNAEYFRWALRLSRAGSVILVDNVVREGAVVDAGSTDAAVRGTRRLYDLMRTEPRVRATAIQTVGSKGYDGFALAVVTNGE